MEPNEENKQTDKIESEAWKQGTDCQGPDGRGDEDKGGKKWKGLVKEQVSMTMHIDNRQD